MEGNHEDLTPESSLTRRGSNLSDAIDILNDAEFMKFKIYENVKSRPVRNDVNSIVLMFY